MSEIAEAELRMEAGVPGRGVGDSSKENGANDTSFSPQT